MTLFFYYGSGDFGGSAIRMGPEGFSFTEAADSGVLSMSRVRVDDPTGSLNIEGHHSFRAIETACSWDSLFRGYFADRSIGRADSLLTGAARIWDSTVYDLNAALEFEVIRGTGGKRPAETDTARLAWILGSGYTGPISTDTGHVFGAGVDLDKADYRGMTMSDVLTDCAAMSGCNYFVAWDDTVGAATLHYYLPTRAHNSSTLKISNVASDVDGATVYAPSRDMRLSKDPARVYSGVYYTYGEKTSAEYRTNSTVLSNIGHKRESTTGDPSVRTATKADAKADKWLSEAETELETITVTLFKVRPADVNLIRAGQRIQLKATHLPGYTSYTWLRIVRRTVEQDGETQAYYNLQLELANPKQGGTKRRKANPVAPDLADGSAVSLTRACLTAGVDQDDGHGGIADSFAYDNSVAAGHDITEGVTYATTYVYGGCPIGESAFNGLTHVEQWLEFNPGTLSGVAGVTFTFTSKDYRGLLGSLFSSYPPLEYGYLASGPPTTYGLGTVLGIADPKGASFFIPAALLVASTTNYVFLRASWQGVDGSACAGTLVAGNLGPLGNAGTPGGGEFFTGQVIIDTWSAITKVANGSGQGIWLPLTGSVNGINKTFTLPGWNLTGVPRIKIGPVEYSPGADYSVDDSAGTITFTFAPWVGADLTGSWGL